MTEQALSDVLAYRSPLGDNLWDLRGTGILQGFWLAGPPPETSDAATLRNKTDQLGKAFTHLTAGDMVQVIYDSVPAPVPPKHQYTHRAAALLHENLRQQFEENQHWNTPTRIYLTHRFESVAKSYITAVLSNDGAQQRRHHEILTDQALRRFGAFLDAASGAIDVTPMNPVGMFRDVLSTVTYHNYPAPLPAPHVRLNKVIGGSDQINGQDPYINDWYLRPVSLTMYPSDTVPQILAVLLQQPGYKTICARYECLDLAELERLFGRERSFWNRKIMGTLAKMFGQWFGKSQQGNQDARNMLDDLDAAWADAQSGTPFGIVTITTVLRDRTREQVEIRAHDFIRECYRMGITARLEEINAAEAVASTWPGYLILNQQAYIANLRKIPLTAYDYADLILPATYWEGTPFIDSEQYEANTPSPFVIGGGGRTPFYFPTHINGVGHQAWFGDTGTGKSTIAWALASSLLAHKDSVLHALDFGHSSYVMARLLEANYYELGAPGSPAFCPLAILDEDGGVEYLAAWFERLFARWNNFELDERTFETFRNALMRAQHKGIRTLFDLRADIAGGNEGETRIRRILRQYSFPHEEGGWGHVFNGSPSINPENRVNIYELSGILGLGINKRASAPAMELVLHNATTRLDGRPTTVLADEWWSILGDEVSAEHMFANIRTLRRRNCAFIGLTQSTIEVANSPFRDLLLGSMPIRVYMPNHKATSHYFAESYLKLQVQPNEITCIASGQPHRDFIVQTPYGTRKASLALDELAQALVGCTSLKDVQRARSIFNDFSGSAFLDAWLSDRLPGGTPSLPVTTEAPLAMGGGTRTLIGQHDDIGSVQ